MNTKIEKLLKAYFRTQYGVEGRITPSPSFPHEVSDTPSPAARQDLPVFPPGGAYPATSHGTSPSGTLLDASPLASGLLLHHFHQALHKLRVDARDEAQRWLRREVGRLTERYGATSGWLFFYDQEGNLEARITHHSRQRGFVLGFDDASGIVPHVARTRRGYLAEDVRHNRDPHYRLVNHDTKSELAVPILDGNGHLLGVLNLESILPFQFSQEQVNDLSQAVSCLVMDMLVLQELEACPYHPRLHRWDLSEVLNRICCSIADSLGEAEGNTQADTTSCTVWYCDHAKGELFVCATNGFDVEYVADATLPMHSFTGYLGHLRRGQICDTLPSTAPLFQRQDKVRQAGIKRIVGTPIYVPGSEPSDLPSATLNIYFLTERRNGTVPDAHTLTLVSEQIGALIGAYRRQRPRLCQAYLKERLHQHPQSGFAGCEIIKNVLCEVLDSGCSVFIRGVGETENHKLFIATTTGVETGGAHTSTGANVDNGSRPFYDLDIDRGYTAFLAGHPECVARKNDVMNELEQGVPEGFPRKPCNKYREKFALSVLDRRRFLGIGVAHNQQPLGVIRLNRASIARPYTRCDEDVLACVSQLEECKRALIDHQRTIEPEIRGGIDGIVKAVASFVRPVPNVGVPERLVTELLQTLLVFFQEHDILHAGLLSNPGRGPGVPSRWYVRQFRGSAAGLAWEDEQDFETKQSDLAGKGHIFTFENFNTRRGGKPGSVAGIRIPVIAWTGGRLLRWLLALDFGERIEWNESHFKVLLYAVQRLCAMLGHSDYAIRPMHWGGATSAHAFASLVDLTQHQQARIHSRGAELRFLRQNQFQTVYTLGERLPETGEGVWKTVRTLETMPKADIDLLGVKHWQDHTGQVAYSVPLRFGSFTIGDIRCLFDEANATQGRDEFVRLIPVLWTRLTCELNEPFGENPIRFRSSREPSGITVWHEQPELDPVGFGGLTRHVAANEFFSRFN